MVLCSNPAYKQLGMQNSAVMILPYSYKGILNPYFYLSFQVPEITDYTMVGRTYRYYIGNPLYSFGYGLSYTSFEYSDLKVTPPSIMPGQSVDVKVTVKNTGSFDADEVSRYQDWAIGILK